MIQIITIHQEWEWKKTVEHSHAYDFYHTWHYHYINKDGDPVLFKFTEGEDFIAFPLLHRDLPHSPEYSDMTSVYGYAGPISNKPFELLPNKMKESFKLALLDFLKKGQYVTVFCRLHPFFDQLELLKGLDGIYDNGKVVYIDLRQSIESQRSKYTNGFLEKIIRLRKKGFYVKEASSLEEIKAFRTIYLQNMEAVNAKDYYLFSEDYFIDLLCAKEFNCKLLLAYIGNKPVAGSIICYTKKIIQSHLVATLNEYRKFSPSKLLTDEISLLGRQLGMYYFNLGGGRGFKDDSLFAYKSSFSDTFLEYKTWRFISDKKAYHEILNKRNIDPQLDIDFFPLYRYNIIEQFNEEEISNQ